MRAIGKYIVLRPIHEEVKTKSGLVVTDTTDLRYSRGEVVKVGGDVESVYDGEVIYYDKHAGHTARIEDKTYTIILERDVAVCV